MTTKFQDKDLFSNLILISVFCVKLISLSLNHSKAVASNYKHTVATVYKYSYSVSIRQKNKHCQNYKENAIENQ